jgi:hypothetical protein
MPPVEPGGAFPTGHPDRWHCRGRDLYLLTLNILHLRPSPTGWARAVTRPGLPQIRTCPIRASGSSDHGFAARQAEWTIRGLGNGYVRSTRLNHAHDFGWARDRRLSHVFHARWTPCLNSVKDRKFPVMP